MLNHNVELARTVLRQGELRLDAQLKLTVAANQRAMTLLSVYIAAALAAAGFAVEGFSSPLSLGALAAAIFLGFGGFFCILAARPMAIHAPGNLPDAWWDDNVENRGLYKALKRESINYAKNIEENRQILKECTADYNKGVILGALSPFIGLFLALVHSVLFPA